MNKSIQSAGIVKHTGPFLGNVDTGELFIHRIENTKAGRTMKAGVDMDSVFFAQSHCAIDRFNFLFVDRE